MNIYNNYNNRRSKLNNIDLNIYINIYNYYI